MPKYGIRRHGGFRRTKRHGTPLSCTKRGVAGAGGSPPQLSLGQSKSKSRGGFCSNQSRSCSGVSWRKSGVSSSTSGRVLVLGLFLVLVRLLVALDSGEAVRLGVAQDGSVGRRRLHPACGRRPEARPAPARRRAASPRTARPAPARPRKRRRRASRRREPRPGVGRERGPRPGARPRRAPAGRRQAPRQGAARRRAARAPRPARARAPPRRGARLLAVEERGFVDSARGAVLGGSRGGGLLGRDDCIFGLLRHLAPGGPERLFLLALDLFLRHSVLALQLEMLPDGIVEYAHRAGTLSRREDGSGTSVRARSTRFLPPRFAR